MKTELFLKGRLRHALEEFELEALEDAVLSTRTLEPRQTVVHRAEQVDQSFYLMSGYMLRYIDDHEGERQLVGIQVPGDFVDLHGFAMKRLDHDVATLSPVEIAIFPHPALHNLVDRHPRLGRILWFSTLLDAAMHREWIFRMGRLSAEGKVAHLICELIERLRLVGLYEEAAFQIPMKQSDFASAVGITKVHANRVFQKLRARKLINSPSTGNRLIIEDEPGLRKLGQFSPDYLYGHGDLQVGHALDLDRTSQ